MISDDFASPKSRMSRSSLQHSSPHRLLPAFSSFCCFFLLLADLLVFQLTAASILPPAPSQIAHSPNTAMATPVQAGFLVDAGDPSSPTSCTRVFLHVVGSGHAALSLREDWRAHLRLTRDALGVRQVRFHGIFDDDMGPVVVLDDSLGNARYNFTRVGRALDYIVRDLGMVPYVELSFMPSALASNPRQTYLQYKAGVSPPRDLQQWGALVGAFATFVVDRYSLDAVAQWRFEVWNEPDLHQPILGGFWSGSMSQYYDLYAATARALKAVAPSLQVGGPATSNTTGYLRPFLVAAQQAGAPVDFLSSHHYPSGADAMAFSREVSLAAAIAAGAELPFVLSEFNSGLRLFCCHDTEYAAAFLAHTATRIGQEKMPVAMSYWAFSDVFEEIRSIDHNLKKPPFHNAYGLLNIDGLPKPSFRALELLGWMPNATLPVRTTTVPTHDNWVQVLAGVPDRVSNTMHVMLVSFAPAPAWGAVAAWNVSLRVSGLLIGPDAANATVWRIDRDHANAWSAWKRMGSPDRDLVNASVLAHLNASSALRGEPQPCASVGATDITMNVRMPKIGVAMVVIRW